jgi:hypothetical protein
VVTAFLALALGQSVELPATIRAQVGAFVLVKPIRLEGGKAVRYFTPDENLSVFPSELLTDPTATVLVASKQGRYKVFAITAAGDKISSVASTIIVVGDGIDPDPQPPQPRPPQPKPPTPKPVDDPIYQQLVGIVGGLGSEKAALPKLAGIYQRASELSNCVDLAALNDAVRNIRDSSGIGQQAMTIREALGGIIEKELGTEPSAPLAGGLGDKAQKLFKRINLVLLELAK